MIWVLWLWFWLSLMVIGSIYTHGISQIIFIVSAVLSLGAALQGSFK